MRRIALLLLLCVVFTACGKYGPPERRVRAPAPTGAVTQDDEAEKDQ